MPVGGATRPTFSTRPTPAGAVDRGKGARALWSTHAAVNATTRYYEERLPLLRGDGYLTAASPVPKEQVRVDLLSLAREAQTVQAQTMKSRVCGRKLYEEIVPFAVGRDGAQASNAFIGPLIDPNSRGFLEAFERHSPAA